MVEKKKIINPNTDELIFPFEQSEIEKADRISKLQTEYIIRENKAKIEKAKRKILEEKQTTEKEKDILEEKADDIKKLYLLDYWMRCWDRVSYCNEVSGQAMFHVTLGQALNTFKIFLEDDSAIDWRLHYLWIQDCLDINTSIYSHLGFKQLKDLPNEFMVLSHNFKNGRDEWKKAIKFDSGLKELYEIELENGEIIHASENHKFFLKDGTEIKVKDLKVNHELFHLPTFQGKHYKRHNGNTNNYDTHCKKIMKNKVIVTKIKEKAKERWLNPKWVKEEMKRRQKMVENGSYKLRWKNGNPKKGTTYETYFSKKKSNRLKKFYSDRMKNGFAAYMNSKIKNPSQPQLDLFDKVKTLYPNAILNHPFELQDKKWISMDIAIPEKKLCIEYDGWYWHQHKLEYDKERDKKLLKHGWKTIRICEENFNSWEELIQ